MRFDKDEIKNSLTIEQVEQFLAEHGGEPIKRIGCLVSRTICHNPPDANASHKLYYYDNTKLFKCYTECAETNGFDIFDLTRKIIKQQSNIEISLYDAELYIINYFSLDVVNDFNVEQKKISDFVIFDKWKRTEVSEEQKTRVEFKEIDANVIKWLPQPQINPWLKEGISDDVMKHYSIKFDPYNYGIIIPHFNIDKVLIGIRERTLIKENEDKGKYMPAIINGVMYNHPLGFNLYNINNSKDNIKKIKLAIIGEGEKFCLGYASFFGEENDISVACCGSNLTSHQFKILQSLGVEEIVIAFDKQFKEIGDKEWARWTKKLTDINNKYGKYVKISFMFDKENLLRYKESPIDGGKEIFTKMFVDRIVIG